MGMEELTEFGMKKSSTLPSLANKYFNSLRGENDEQIFTYKDPFMRFFVRKSINRGRCNAFNQQYKSETSDEFFNKISKKLDVNVKICDLPKKISNFSANMRNNMQKNSIQIIMIIEILIKRKELFILTKNLTCYQFTNSCQNQIQIILKWIMMLRRYILLLFVLKIQYILKTKLDSLLNRI